MKILENIKSLISEGNGKPSSQRILTIAVVILPLLIWIIISLYKMELADIPMNVLSLMALGMGTKVISKFAEIKGKI